MPDLNKVETEVLRRVHEDRHFIEIGEFPDYTFHFTWACYAIAWGIQKYDESKP